MVGKALEKDCDLRYQSAADLRTDLKRLKRESESARTNVARPSVTHVTKRRVVRAAAAVAVVALLAGLIAIVIPRISDTARKEPLVERRLTANNAGIVSFTLSRDGKHAAYSDGSEKLHVLLIESGELRQLQSSFIPQDWFPDGEHLLVTKADSPGLWRLSAWNLSLDRLSDREGTIVNARVSPNGSQVASVFQDWSAIWLMGADGEGAHEIAKRDGQVKALAWSPTGRRLAYIATRRHPDGSEEYVIETCDEGGRNVRPILVEPTLSAWNGVFGLQWLADNRVLYALFKDDHDRNLWSIEVDPNTGERRGDAVRLTDWPDSEPDDFQATVDGKDLVVHKTHSEYGMFFVDLSAACRTFTPRPLTRDAWTNVAGAWTSNSKSIFFHSNRQGRFAIFKQDVDLEAPVTTVVSGAENYLYPVLSSGMVVYRAKSSPDRTAASRRLMSSPLSGGVRATLLTRISEWAGYACNTSPDRCIFAEVEANQVVFYALDPTAGKGGEVGRLEFKPGTFPAWSLSPDGSKIALVNNGDKAQILFLHDHQVTELRPQDLKPSQLLQEVCWSADGTHLFVTTWLPSSYELLSVDLAGRSKVVYTSTLSEGWMYHPIASPNGRSLAFTRRKASSDLVMLENF
jgi:Tol biopolymer transport system component